MPCPSLPQAGCTDVPLSKRSVTPSPAALFSFHRDASAGRPVRVSPRSGVSSYAFLEIVNDNPKGITLRQSDRHLVEIADRLMAQDRAGIIKSMDRNQLISILKLLGRSPMDRHRLGLADNPPERDAPFDFQWKEYN